MSAIAGFFASKLGKWIVIAVLAVALFVTGFVKGLEHQEGKDATAAQIATERVSVVRVKQAEVSEHVTAEYFNNLMVIHDQGDQLLRGIPTYVTEQASARCVLPVGFVRVLNAAAEGTELAESSGSTNDPAADSERNADSGLSLEEATRIIAGNYQTYRNVAEQLKALQNYANQTSKLGDASK